MKIKAREFREEEGKTNCKESNTKDTTICLPGFGFQTKPTSPLRHTKGHGLFQTSQVILKIKIESFHFSRSRDQSLCKVLHTSKPLARFTMDESQKSKFKNTRTRHSLVYCHLTMHYHNSHSNGYRLHDSLYCGTCEAFDYLRVLL
jgi:hypothetical protein